MQELVVRPSLLMSAKFSEDVIQICLQGWTTTGIERQPLVLNLAQEDSNLVELRAVRWQQVQSQSSLLEQLHYWLDRFGCLHRGGDHNDRRRPSHLKIQQVQKPVNSTAVVCQQSLAVNSLRLLSSPDTVESHTPVCGGSMALTRRAPSALVGRGQRKVSFIDKVQGHLVAAGLACCNIGYGSAKSGEVSFFVSECWVCFYKNPSRTKNCCITQMLPLTLNVFCSFSNNWGALTALALAKSRWVRACPAWSLRGAPLRFASINAFTPLASHASRSAVTVSWRMPCSFVTVSMDVSLWSMNRVRERLRARHLLPRSAMRANCRRSDSDRTRERGVLDMVLSYVVRLLIQKDLALEI